MDTIEPHNNFFAESKSSSALLLIYEMNVQDRFCKHGMKEMFGII